MEGLILTVLRYLTLLFLYVFLFSVIRMMFKNLPPDSTAKPDPGIANVRDTGVQIEGGVRKEEGRLIVVSSPEAHPEMDETYFLGEETTIGRSNESHVVIHDPYSSQEHAVIFMKNSQYWVQDLNSKNGTFLNEVILEKPTVLADGDLLRIGGTAFRFIKWL